MESFLGVLVLIAIVLYMNYRRMKLSIEGKYKLLFEEEIKNSLVYKDLRKQGYSHKESVDIVNNILAEME